MEVNRFERWTFRAKFLCWIEELEDGNETR